MFSSHDQKENCNYDHIPFNSKVIGDIFLSVISRDLFSILSFSNTDGIAKSGPRKIVEICLESDKIADVRMLTN